MTKRRRAREYALQMLFQQEFIGKVGNFESFWRGKTLNREVTDYAEELVRGTVKHRDDLDKFIRKAAQHWAVDRMAAVDRNILRLGAYEIIYKEDIPDAVAINEALEVAKRFSSQESASFINGILDRISKEKRNIY